MLLLRKLNRSQNKDISEAERKIAGMMMKKREDTRVQKEQALIRELEIYRENGCIICLNGRPSAPQRVISACLREKSSYMRDFVSDDQMRIRKVDFIEITEKE